MFPGLQRKPGRIQEEALSSVSPFGFGICPCIKPLCASTSPVDRFWVLLRAQLWFVLSCLVSTQRDKYQGVLRYKQGQCKFFWNNTGFQHLSSSWMDNGTPLEAGLSFSRLELAESPESILPHFVSVSALFSNVYLPRLS